MIQYDGPYNKLTVFLQALNKVSQWNYVGSGRASAIKALPHFDSQWQDPHSTLFFNLVLLCLNSSRFSDAEENAMENV